MRQKRKRAPGGGRKPSGPFAQNSAQLTIRMPADMRAELEAVAQKKGWSLTQELLWRLRASLSQRSNPHRDRAGRALGFLVGDIARQISSGDSNWHLNPFLFRAFTLAVAKLFDALAPVGEMVPPYDERERFFTEHLKQMNEEEAVGIRVLLHLNKRDAEKHKTPEDLGDSVAAVTLDLLLRRSPIGDSFLGDSYLKDPDSIVRGVAKVAQEQSYAMSDVRRDLGIDEPKEPQS